MKCDIFVLAEGVASDARGALTLVGLNQRAISVNSLPFRVTQKVVLGFTDESTDSLGRLSDEDLGGELSIRVVDPAGNSQFTINQSFKIPKVPKPTPNLPQFSYIVADIVVSGAMHGAYTADISYQFTCGEVEGKKFALYIVPPISPVSSSETPRAEHIMS